MTDKEATAQMLIARSQLVASGFDIDEFDEVMRYVDALQARCNELQATIDRIAGAY